MKDNEPRPMPPGFWDKPKMATRFFSVAAIGAALGLLYAGLAVLGTSWRQQWPLSVVWLVISASSATVGLVLRRRGRARQGTPAASEVRSRQ